MPNYVIERDIPGIHNLNDRDKQAAALNSYRALKATGPEVHWLHSYISKDKTHCVYFAEHEDLIHEHAEKSGIPVTKIHKVEYLLDPSISE